MWNKVLHGLIFIGLFGCQTSEKKDFLGLGNQYAKDGLYREALDSYKQAQAANPEDMLVQRNLGIVYVKVGNFKGAVNHLEKSISFFADNFDANFYLAEAYRGQDKFAEAIFHYQKALKLKENDPKTLKALSWSYFKIRYYSESLLLVNKLRKNRPDDEQAIIIAARTLLKLHRQNEAFELIREGKAQASSSSLPYFLSLEGDATFEKGSKKEALDLYQQALKIQPLLASALFGAGRCYLQDKASLQENDRVIAKDYLEKAVRVRPELTEAHLLLGTILEDREPKKALKYYKIFLRQAEADPEFLEKLPEISTKVTGLERTSKAG